MPTSTAMPRLNKHRPIDENNQTDKNISLVLSQLVSKRAYFQQLLDRHAECHFELSSSWFSFRTMNSPEQKSS